MTLLLLSMLGRLWPEHAVPSGTCPAGQGTAGEQQKTAGKRMRKGQMLTCGETKREITGVVEECSWSNLV